MTKFDSRWYVGPIGLCTCANKSVKASGSVNVAELAVVEIDLVGPAAAEQRPVLRVDSGGVANEHLGDLHRVGIHAGRLTDKLDSGQQTICGKSGVNGADCAEATAADRGQRRASFQQARSRETKQSLVQAATTLWRTNGYARTTVADICRAAGVSKALFYFYFPRKEDVLLEVGIVSTDAAHRRASAMLRKSYDVPAVIRAVLESLEETMRGSTPELLTEAILEGYRQTLAGHDHLERTSVVFAEVFDRAVADGKLPARLRRRPRRDRRAVTGQRGRPAVGRRTFRRPVVRRRRRSRHRRPRGRLQLARDLMDHVFSLDENAISD